MEVLHSSLVIVGANTPECKVFWKGKEVVGMVAVSAMYYGDDQKVVIKVKEDSMFTEMKAAGIEVRRVL